MHDDIKIVCSCSAKGVNAYICESECEKGKRTPKLVARAYEEPLNTGRTHKEK